MKVFTIFLAVFSLLIFSCSKPDPQLEYFIVKNDYGINIPVRVLGDVNSKIFVIYVEDGAFRVVNPKGKPHNSLYATVYVDFETCFDKRNRNNIESIKNSIDLTIEVLIERYGNNISIFMFGYDFDGSFALLSASIINNFSKINGVIAGNPITNFVKTANASKQKFTEIMQDVVESKDSVNHIGDEFLETLNGIEINNHETALEYYDFLRNNLYFDELLGESSPFCDSFIEFYNDPAETDFERDILNINCFAEFEDTENFDIEKYVQNIKSPVGLFWLRDDIHNPFTIGEELFNTLQVDNKELHVFDNSCAPYFPVGYEDRVIEFIEKYK